jgi:hypothetical protein
MALFFPIDAMEDESPQTFDPVYAHDPWRDARFPSVMHQEDNVNAWISYLPPVPPPLDPPSVDTRYAHDQKCDEIIYERDVLLAYGSAPEITCFAFKRALKPVEERLDKLQTQIEGIITTLKETWDSAGNGVGLADADCLSQDQRSEDTHFLGSDYLQMVSLSSAGLIEAQNGTIAVLMRAFEIKLENCWYNCMFSSSSIQGTVPVVENVGKDMDELKESFHGCLSAFALAVKEDLRGIEKSQQGLQDRFDHLDHVDRTLSDTEPKGAYYDELIGSMRRDGFDSTFQEMLASVADSDNDLQQDGASSLGKAGDSNYALSEDYDEEDLSRDDSDSYSEAGGMEGFVCMRCGALHERPSSRCLNCRHSSMQIDMNNPPLVRSHV